MPKFNENKKMFEKTACEKNVSAAFCGRKNGLTFLLYYGKIVSRIFVSQHTLTCCADSTDEYLDEKSSKA